METKRSAARLWRDPDRIFMGFIYLCLILLFVVMAYPLLVTVSSSLSNPMYVMQGKVMLFPIEPTVASYVKVFQHGELWRSFGNSVFYTVFGTAINIIMTICASYPLSRKDWVGRKFFSMMVLLTMFFSGGMIPLYLAVRQYSMLNTVWAMVLPGAVTAYNVVVMRTFFVSTIPDELREAAQIDGCGNITFLLKIVIPLSVPIITIVGLFYAVGHWNSFQPAMMYLSGRQKYPLQLILREILLSAQAAEMLSEVSGLTDQMFEAEGIRYAMIVVASMPMILIYPLVQKFFRKGVMLGAIKG